MIRVVAVVMSVVAGYAAGASQYQSGLLLLVVLGLILGGLKRATQAVIFAILAQGAQSFTLPVVDFNVAFAAAFALLPLWLIGHRGLLREPGFKWAVGYAGVTIACFALSAASSGVGDSWGHVLESLNYLIFFLLIVSVSLRERNALAMPVALAGVVHLILGSYEVASGNSIFYSDWKIEEATRFEGYTRAASTVADPNYLALTLLVLGFITLDLAGSGNSSWRRLLGLCLLAAVPLTFSRAGMIAVIVAVAVLAARKPTGWVKGALFAGIASALGYFLIVSGTVPLLETIRDRLAFVGSSDSSVTQRVLVQQLAIDLFQDNWWLGTGPGQFPKFAIQLHDASRPFDVQTAVLNTYLYVGLAGGVVAAGAFVALVSALVRKGLAESPKLAAAAMGLAGAILTLDAFNLTAMWLLFGLTMASVGGNRRLNPSIKRSNRNVTLATSRKGQRRL